MHTYMNIYIYIYIHIYIYIYTHVHIYICCKGHPPADESLDPRDVSIV